MKESSMKTLSASLLILALALPVAAQQKSVNPIGQPETATPADSPTLSGSGTPGAVPLWVTSDTLGDSNIFQASNKNIGIGTKSPQGTLDVKGTINALGFTIGHNLF